MDFEQKTYRNENLFCWPGFGAFWVKRFGDLIFREDEVRIPVWLLNVYAWIPEKCGAQFLWCGALVKC